MHYILFYINFYLKKNSISFQNKKIKCWVCFSFFKNIKVKTNKIQKKKTKKCFCLKFYSKKIFFVMSYNLCGWICIYNDNIISLNEKNGKHFCSCIRLRNRLFRIVISFLFYSQKQIYIFKWMYVYIYEQIFL